jgi:hypothetical protein
MDSLALFHLGEFVPLYLRDCVHQLRLWSPIGKSRIFIVVEPVHRTPEGLPTPFWDELVNTYGVELCYTDELQPTEAHISFRQHYKGDTGFRNGYWRHVKERFFYMEELMRKERLSDMIAMEYDILLYGPIDVLSTLLRAYARGRITYAMDAHVRGHPGFLYLPCPEAAEHLAKFFLQLVAEPYDDMQTLALYREIYKGVVATLPLITPERNASISPRKSLVGLECAETEFLSNGFEEMGCLFDSLSVGQCIGGIDPRNSSGKATVGMINETALYSMEEMPFGWTKIMDLWIPVLDGKPLATMHMHSKALAPFLSDHNDMPKADYDIATLKASLEPNEKVI